MKTYIVMIPAEKYGPEIAEKLHNKTFENFEDAVKKGNHSGGSILGIQDFVDMCNDTSCALENYWLSYIHVKDTRF